MRKKIKIKDTKRKNTTNESKEEIEMKDRQKKFAVLGFMTLLSIVIF